MQARRRHEPAERERRLENLEVVTALGERDATRPDNRRLPDSSTGPGELSRVTKLTDGIGVGVDAWLSGRPSIEVHRLAQSAAPNSWQCTRRRRHRLQYFKDEKQRQGSSEQ